MTSTKKSKSLELRDAFLWALYACCLPVPPNRSRSNRLQRRRSQLARQGAVACLAPSTGRGHGGHGTRHLVKSSELQEGCFPFSCSTILSNTCCVQPWPFKSQLCSTIPGQKPAVHQLCSTMAFQKSAVFHHSRSKTSCPSAVFNHGLSKVSCVPPFPVKNQLSISCVQPWPFKSQLCSTIPGQKPAVHQLFSTMAFQKSAPFQP